MGETVFFKKNGNGLVNISNWKKSVKSGIFKNMYFNERVTRELQFFYLCNDFS